MIEKKEVKVLCFQSDLLNICTALFVTGVITPKAVDSDNPSNAIEKAWGRVPRGIFRNFISTTRFVPTFCKLDFVCNQSQFLPNSACGTPTGYRTGRGYRSREYGPNSILPNRLVLIS